MDKMKTLNPVFHSFERGLEIIKQNIKGQQISLKIASMLDIMITYSRTSENPDYIIALAMYTIEIENTFERDAMMHRIISNLNDDIPHPNSTDPYEIIAYLLQKMHTRKTIHKIIGLISDVVDKINNPFVKLSGFCTIADLCNSIERIRSCTMCLNMCSNHSHTANRIRENPNSFGFDHPFLQIDKNMADICLRKGIKYSGKCRIR